MSKRIAIVVLCLAVAWAGWKVFGQSFGGFVHDQPFLIASRTAVAADEYGCAPVACDDFSGSSTMAAWWHSADVQIGNRIRRLSDAPASGTNVFWCDRIISRVASVALDYFPITNTASGIFIIQDTTNAQKSGLTNYTLSIGTNQTICFIWKPFRSTMEPPQDRIIFSPWDGSDGTQLNANTHGGIFLANAGYYNWGTVYSGGPALTDNTQIIRSNVITDLILVQSNTVVYFYTNGVLATSFSRTPPANGYPWKWIMGENISSGAGGHGWVYDVVAWSNNLSSAQVSNVHYWATNSYAYTP